MKTKQEWKRKRQSSFDSWLGCSCKEVVTCNQIHNWFFLIWGLERNCLSPVNNGISKWKLRSSSLVSFPVTLDSRKRLLLCYRKTLMMKFRAQGGGVMSTRRSLVISVWWFTLGSWPFACLFPLEWRRPEKVQPQLCQTVGHCLGSPAGEASSDAK